MTSRAELSKTPSTLRQQWKISYKTNWKADGTAKHFLTEIINLVPNISVRQN